MPDLLETYSPSNLIQIAVRNMASRNWSMPLDPVNFAVYLDKGMVEIDFMILAPYKKFRSLAYVQNELTTEIYNLLITSEPMDGSEYSVLNVKQITYEQYEKENKKLGTNSSFGGGNPFIPTAEYLKRREGFPNAKKDKK